MDLTRYHPRPCLQYYIKRCLGPCVEGLTTPEIYQEAVRDVKLFLEGRPDRLGPIAAQAHGCKPPKLEEFERAAKYRDLLSTVEQLQEKQRIAAAEGDDADVFGYHYENGMLAVNLFHMRGGKIVDRREFSGKTCRSSHRCVSPRPRRDGRLGCPAEAAARHEHANLTSASRSSNALCH